MSMRIAERRLASSRRCEKKMQRSDKIQLLRDFLLIGDLMRILLAQGFSARSVFMKLSLLLGTIFSRGMSCTLAVCSTEYVFSICYSDKKRFWSSFCVLRLEELDPSPAAQDDGNRENDHHTPKQTITHLLMECGG